MNEKVDRAVFELIESYSAPQGIKIHHLDRYPLPSQLEIIRALDAIQELIFPGYVGTQETLTASSLRLRVESRMTWLYEVLTEQINRAVSHGTKLRHLFNYRARGGRMRLRVSGPSAARARHSRDRRAGRIRRRPGGLLPG
ncbi:MAG: hypothetical protein WKF30_11590 [Pyrinomonadaceae bacterium]